MARQLPSSTLSTDMLVMMAIKQYPHLVDDLDKIRAESDAQEAAFKIRPTVKLYHMRQIAGILPPSIRKH